MNKWQRHPLQQRGWFIAWLTWLILVLIYLDYRVVREESTPDVIHIKRAEVVVDMKMVSLPIPPSLPQAPSPHDNQKKSTGKEIDKKQSRVWLSKLEDGEGPNIVFSWPSDNSEREWIQQRLYSCGVRLGRWSNVRLRAIEAGTGTVSGFIRLFSGAVSVEENSRLQALAGEGRPVRVFPRRLDIHLLTQLSSVMSGKFMEAKQVSAEYKRRMNGVGIRNIQMDGEAFEQGIVFLPENGQCS